MSEKSIWAYENLLYNPNTVNFLFEPDGGIVGIMGAVGREAACFPAVPDC